MWGGEVWEMREGEQCQIAFRCRGDSGEMCSQPQPDLNRDLDCPASDVNRRTCGELMCVVT